MLAFSVALGAPASAENYFIRVDGGDHDQCNGRSDRALVAAVDKQSECAWKHPFVALPPGKPARIAGGDSLSVRPGSYRMGLGATGADACDRAWPWDCHMPAIPSGSLQRPTRISGAGIDGKCSIKPELWGAERAARIINLEGSNHIEISCLEITDHASCVEQHCHGGSCAGEVRACPREQPPFGDWSGTGIYASDSRAVSLRDLDVHGMAMRGIHAGRLRDWSLERVAIVGNGWSGWDGDLGKEGSSNLGTLEFREVEIAWNGCVERYPGREHFGCWGQSSGGYGDGLGTALSAGDWKFDRVKIHHNASDGLDLLYLTPPASTTISNSKFYANAGNQIKTSGNAKVSANHINGDCGALGKVGLAVADHCRAGGNSLALGLKPGVSVTLEDNEIRGQGDCLVVVESGDQTSSVRMQGNRLFGSQQIVDPGKRSCGFYAHESKARVELKDNQFMGVRGWRCPTGNSCSAAD